MDKVFLDANVLFSAAYRSDSGLRRLWQLPNVTLMTSVYAVEEARRNLDSKQQAELEPLLRTIEIVPHAQADRRLEDAFELAEKDRPILLAAIDNHATHLLTGDITHFGRYLGKRVGSVSVSTPGAYLNNL